MVSLNNVKEKYKPQPITNYMQAKQNAIAHLESD